MCGIAGILRVHHLGDGTPPHPLTAIPEAWLDVLDDAVKHRGPDGAARFRDRAIHESGATVDVALVHRRLSIIDIEGGAQPMVHDGRRLRPELTTEPGAPPRLAHELAHDAGLVALVFNGCVYNHRDLRAELGRAGHAFQTDHADTEAILHAWREHGEALPARLDSMHAIAVWDRARATITAFRDRAGEKPLYDTTASAGRGAVFAFASTAAALVRLHALGFGDSTGANIDARNLHEWIGRGCGRGTPFFEIDELEPGETRVTQIHVSEVPGVSIEFDMPMDELPEAPPLPRRSPATAMSEDEAADLIARAVRGRLEADVPLGCLLSGGVDSSLIAALAGAGGAPVHAFTVRMPSEPHDESEWAARVASHIGAEHTVLDCEADPAADLASLIPRLGLPFADSSLLPTHWVCRAARGAVKVALAGDGGDELFGGYQRYAGCRLGRRWRPALACVPTPLLSERDPRSRPAQLARLARAARRGGYHDLTAVFPRADMDRLVPSHRWLSRGRGPFPRDPLDDDFGHYLPDDILRKSDTASMHVALELRAPLLSRELITRCESTPLDSLMPGGRLKGLLRAVARRRLPAEVVDRPKQGFAIPIGEWFRTDHAGLRQLLHDHLGAADPFPGLERCGAEISRGAVRRLLREHDEAGEDSLFPWRGRDHSQRLYMLLVLSIWARWLARQGAE